MATSKDKAKYSKQRVDAVNKLGTEDKKKTKKTANTVSAIEGKIEKRGRGDVSANQMNYAGNEMRKGTIYADKKTPKAKKALGGHRGS